MGTLHTAACLFITVNKWIIMCMSCYCRRPIYLHLHNKYLVPVSVYFFFLSLKVFTDKGSGLSGGENKHMRYITVVPFFFLPDHQRTSKFCAPCRNSSLSSSHHTFPFAPVWLYSASHLRPCWAPPPPSILSRRDFSLVSITGLNRASICSLSEPHGFPWKKKCVAHFSYLFASGDHLSIGLQLLTKQTVL